ncbi:hypothetical protein VNO80_19324 [Phaseolus coccineus]|uniref:Uncharacterized protein n=1 Tax=Phaseolus coccineus TaxID=3886 RepID=A0AAN9R054_PHACN
MPACLSRSGDARMSRALAMSACLSRPGNARMSRALAIYHMMDPLIHRLDSFDGCVEDSGGSNKGNGGKEEL